ncbi:MAG: YceH family protein [Pirellulales bacterium]
MSTDTVAANTSATEPAARPRWQPIEALERRVLGVLVEKAKTTPENYPLSINALKNGCNQKNNRSPLMNVEEDQVDAALESLRKLGAVSEIQGSGRVDKYRHLAYDWLGVEKVELAVMAELLLRGAQTVGELRGRAARMEPIKDMTELRPVLDSLQSKGLVIFLTPEGRGAIVTHTLYQEREMEKVRREAANMVTSEESSPREAPPVAARSVPAAVPPPAVSPSSGPEVARLREELAALRRELSSTRTEFQSALDELRRGLEELNRQLGN